MSTGKKSSAPEPGRYHVSRAVESEEIRLPRVAPPSRPGPSALPVQSGQRARAASPTVYARSIPVDQTPVARANALLADIAFSAPGSELVYLESVRALGRAGLEAVRREFPGAVWFDRHAPIGREPRGRYTSPLASLLFRLGPEAYETVGELLGSDRADIRYYAALLAIDLDADAIGPPLYPLLVDDDIDIARLALSFASSSTSRAQAAVAYLESVISTFDAGEHRERARTLMALLRAISG